MPVCRPVHRPRRHPDRHRGSGSSLLPWSMPACWQCRSPADRQGESSAAPCRRCRCPRNGSGRRCRPCPQHLQTGQDGADGSGQRDKHPDPHRQSRSGYPFWRCSGSECGEPAQRSGRRNTSPAARHGGAGADHRSKGPRCPRHPRRTAAPCPRSAAGQWHRASHYSPSRKNGRRGRAVPAPAHRHGRTL